MLIGRKEFHSMDKRVCELEKQIDELEDANKELSDKLDQALTQFVLLQEKEVEEDLITDSDGMYNFQKYKAKSELREAGESKS